MNSISDLLLSGLITYGAPMFGLVLMVAAIGLPIPSSLLVIAAGAFSRLGTLDWTYTAAMGLAGAVAGDSLSYALGHWGGKRVQSHFGNPALWAKAHSTFNHGSGMAVFITRFVLTAIALPVNLMAGSSGNFRKFLAYVVAGEALWIAIYGGLGYLFGSQWELVNDRLSDFGSMALGLAVLAVVFFLLLIKRKALGGLRVKFNQAPVVESLQ
jgi:membrane protein DedA with SNARE-associated domain